MKCFTLNRGSYFKAKRKVSSGKGMTMAEMLIVVAIVVVLFGVAFVAVNSHQRSLGHLERESIAKEIFVAAQNHLTVAYGAGYMGLEETDPKNNPNNPFGIPASDGKYYFIVNGNIRDDSVLGQMLPFGSIDETVRAGGSYIIRYEKETGLVLDVFYCTRNGSPEKFNHQFLSGGETYDDVLLLAGDDNKSERRNYMNGCIVGWYGASTGASLPRITLIAPTIEVINSKKLYVKLTDNNLLENDGKYSLKLIISGETSKAEKAIIVKKSGSREQLDSSGRVSRISPGPYEIILDDITNSNPGSYLHFADIDSDNGIPFIPGENVAIYAVAYSTEYLATPQKSAEYMENSLFAEMSNNTGYINNIRHLQNLDKKVSKLNVSISSAIQVVDDFGDGDLDWKNDDGGFWISNTITAPRGGSLDNNYSSSYYPINPDYILSYDGKGFSILNIISTGCTNAGLFGISDKVASVSNLQLIDFSVSGGDSAGALAGKLTGTVVTNVIARNTGVDDSTKSAVNVKATDGSGSAGGLIGIQSGGSVNYSAAALIINGNTAGGLIGTVSDGASITGCYSAGHTKKGSYELWIEGDGGSLPAHQYDVEGATAGGLVGNAGSTNISYSYSTCSVKASSRGGGFAALTTGKITNCYCTGRVWPDFVKDQNNNNKQVLIHNAFRTQLEEGGLAAESSGYYYKIINEVLNADTNQIEYKEPYRLPGSNTTPAIKALDESADSYNEFVGSASKWKDARPYDNAALGKYYNGKYNLQTVLQLAGSNAPAGSENYFIKDHYGDWPAPEIFIINSK